MHAGHFGGDGDSLDLFGCDLYACFDGAVADDVVDVSGGEVPPRAIGVLDLYLVANHVPTKATVIEEILEDVAKSNLLLVRIFGFLRFTHNDYILK